MIIDHNCTKLSSIPAEYVTAAKQELHIAYGHTSHSQPLNANQKAYAAWWLWARLAGWDSN
jgi:hypothetical protein